MLLCVTWLLLSQDGMPFRGRVTCEVELDSFLKESKQEGWGSCDVGLQKACL